MNFFKLFAHGVAFDVDSYLETDTIGFDRVWHTGEQGYKTNGIEISLGDGSLLGIDDQDLIAAEFLEHYENELIKLQSYPGVDTFVLGLQFRTNLYPNLRGFCMSFSARLMRFALRTGVEPTFYVDLVPTDEWAE